LQNEENFWKKEIPLNMAAPFVFKQFTITQEKSAFKLGTDSVVLGGWLPVKKYSRVLDVGAGCGIMSLMVAQRFELAHVLAVELDELSFTDCTNNFSQAPWNKRLEATHADVLDWSKKNPDERFDLIISNPPYFSNSLQNADTRKSTARHTQTLSFDSLVNLVNQHLAPGGYFAVILPVVEFETLNIKLNEENIFADEVVVISSFKHSTAIRKAGLFSFEKKITRVEDQYLYKEDKTRSDWYIKISNDFYVK
jgi:tRNA1Val (adenine37-N6)-methyltransferase